MATGTDHPVTPTRHEAATQTPTGNAAGDDFFDHILHELEVAKRERYHYETQARSLAVRVPLVVVVVALHHTTP